jgi:hypothetical protein
MDMKKGVISAFALLLLISFLSSQSLVEVAKKEKERRAKLKGIKSIVVTNEVLANKKIEPSVSIRSPGYPTSETSAVTEIPKRRSLDHILAQIPGEKEQTSFSDLKTLEAKWKEAQELEALLGLQLNALWNKYYSVNDMTPKELIQQQISETYLRLQKAQHDADQAKKEWDEARRKKQKKTSENR